MPPSRLFSTYLITPADYVDAVRRGQQKLVPLCGSWFMPNDPQGRTGRQVFEQSRIPGARFFDLDEIKDESSPYPHMLPSAAKFTEAMNTLGIDNESTVVVYDSKELGLFSAPRVAWTLKFFGHEKVHILNTFRLYCSENYPLETDKPTTAFEKTSYEAKLDKDLRVVDFAYVRDFVSGHARQVMGRAAVLDARPKGRFHGTDPEPRPGLSSGHMPRSISVPFSDLLDPETKAMYPPEKLKAILDLKLSGLEGPFISSCGTGVTAAVIDAALEQVGFPKEKRLLYDGSWTEWAQRVNPEENLILKTQPGVHVEDA